MNPIAANDSADVSTTGCITLAQAMPACRVLLYLPAELHVRISERSRADGRDTSALYQTALKGFARSLALGVRLPLSRSEFADVSVLVQLPAGQREWLRRLSSRLRLSEGDIVAAAADWWLSGGTPPRPTAVSEGLSRPLRAHHPPSGALTA